MSANSRAGLAASTRHRLASSAPAHRLDPGRCPRSRRAAELRAGHSLRARRRARSTRFFAPLRVRLRRARRRDLARSPRGRRHRTAVSPSRRRRPPNARTGAPLRVGRVQAAARARTRSSGSRVDPSWTGDPLHAASRTRLRRWAASSTARARPATVALVSFPRRLDSARDGGPRGDSRRNSGGKNCQTARDERALSARAAHSRARLARAADLVRRASAPPSRGRRVVREPHAPPRSTVSTRPTWPSRAGVHRRIRMARPTHGSPVRSSDGDA